MILYLTTEFTEYLFSMLMGVVLVWVIENFGKGGSNESSKQRMGKTNN